MIMIMASMSDMKPAEVFGGWVGIVMGKARNGPRVGDSEFLLGAHGM